MRSSRDLFLNGGDQDRVGFKVVEYHDVLKPQYDLIDAEIFWLMMSEKK